MIYDKKKLRKLYEALPHGSLVKIAERAGVTSQAVRDILAHGKYENDAVAEAALEIAGPQIQKRKELQEKLNQLG